MSFKGINHEVDRAGEAKRKCKDEKFSILNRKRRTATA